MKKKEGKLSTDIVKEDHKVISEIAKVEDTTIIKKENDNNLDVKPLEEESKTIKYQKYIYVILPMTIPGSGKTSLISLCCSKLESELCSCSIVSSEEIRLQIKKDHPEIGDKCLYQSYRNKFVKKLGNSLKNIESLFHKDIKKKNHIIFMDKCNPPNALENAIKYINYNFIVSVRI